MSKAKLDESNMYSSSHTLTMIKTKKQQQQLIVLLLFINSFTVKRSLVPFINFLHHGHDEQYRMRIVAYNYS